MRLWIAIAVAVVGYGGIGFLIWWVHRQEKKRRNVIIERIRKRMRTYHLNEEGTAYELVEEENSKCT